MYYLFKDADCIGMSKNRTKLQGLVPILTQSKYVITKDDKWYNPAEIILTDGKIAKRPIKEHEHVPEPATGVCPVGKDAITIIEGFSNADQLEDGWFNVTFMIDTVSFKGFLRQSSDKTKTTIIQEVFEEASTDSRSTSMYRYYKNHSWSPWFNLGFEESQGGGGGDLPDDLVNALRVLMSIQTATFRSDHAGAEIVFKRDGNGSGQSPIVGMNIYSHNDNYSSTAISGYPPEGKWVLQTGGYGYPTIAEFDLLGFKDGKYRLNCTGYNTGITAESLGSTTVRIQFRLPDGTFHSKVSTVQGDLGGGRFAKVFV